VPHVRRQQRLDGAPLVHDSVGLGNVFERQGERALVDGRRTDA
jgi:hypothetical protein